MQAAALIKGEPGAKKEMPMIKKLAAKIISAALLKRMFFFAAVMQHCDSLLLGFVIAYGTFRGETIYFLTACAGLLLAITKTVFSWVDYREGVAQSDV